MHALAVLEIIPGNPGSPCIDLLCAAYRASAQGLIILVLHDVSPRAVDNALDDLVRRMPLGIPGLRYVDIRSGEAIGEALRSTDLVLAATREFRSWAEAFGFSRRDGRTGFAGLEILVRPVGRFEDRPVALSLSPLQTPVGLTVSAH
ncbi:hypothetical protein [Sphingomonas sp. LaA6.9]|uniref:hypothetical protein n=1 Tax=Sphingomonas sp. LaA6.9 TaxID=2919914 RepID=UPI001F4FC359|nr:hypothetical protein [Sphingomonas sp. LaA6.9]MCJ8159138.1 hypothetical protein [Sphingomonas sp. LaA6.9]